MTEIQQRLKTLTRREHEFLNHVIDGLANKQVADQMGITLRTVKAHRAKVMAKMGATSVAQLVAMVLRSEQKSKPDSNRNKTEKELPLHHKLEDLFDQYLKASGLVRCKTLTPAQRSLWDLTTSCW
jgi:DNA-binding CsgD family transcriptional regulator